jgi:hypothetical protein
MKTTSRTDAWRSLGACAFGLSLILAACTSGTPAPSATATAVSTPTPSASAATTPQPTASPAPTSTPSPPPTPTAAPSTGPCASAHLVARVTPVEASPGVFEGWSGAAGHRVANVELTNTGPACTLASLSRPQLIEGHGAVVIDGTAPGPSAILAVGPGAVLKTVVQDANYCGPALAAPVTVAFVLNGGTDRVVALPVTPKDTSGVPPCNGAPGSAGDIEMQPWAP